MTRGTDTADERARRSDEVTTGTQRRRARGPASAVPPRDGYIGAGGTPQTAIGGWWELHPRSLRAVAVLALFWGCAWIAYRAGFSWRGTNPIAFAALVLVEGFNLLSLALLTFAGWDWGREPPSDPGPGWAVDVFVCTYDEPIEVVEATLAGCAALRYPHTTYLLDDGCREEMRTLAERWGASWMTRPENSHAKAGNINHALTRTYGDLIFFLDADHVPLPDALDLTVGYFSDDRVALVQSPHDFYNQDSVQHYEAGRHEQSLFFEVVCPGKDRHNASFWCGSATVVRRVALEEVGGVATETIAEDFHTTIKMHCRGWASRYHNQVLVQGLAPVDLDGYLLQRDRWARGNLAVFRLPESPLRRNGLDLRQRIAYFSSLFAYGVGFAYLLMLGVLIAALGGGVLPARAGETELLALWLPATVLAIASTVALCRGHMRLGESSRYTIVSAEIFARVLRCAFLPSKTKFKVTPKEGVDTGGWAAVRRLRLVLLLAVLLVGALVWRVLALTDVVRARDRYPASPHRSRSHSRSGSCPGSRQPSAMSRAAVNADVTSGSRARSRPSWPPTPGRSRPQPSPTSRSRGSAWKPTSGSNRDRRSAWRRRWQRWKARTARSASRGSSGRAVPSATALGGSAPRSPGWTRIPSASS